MSRLGRVLRSDSAALVAGSRLLAMLLTLLTAPIVARAVGPEGRGAVATALAAFAIIPIVLALGMPLNLRRLSLGNQHEPSHRTSRDLTITMFVVSTFIAWALDVTLFSVLGREVQVVATVGVAISPLFISWLNDQSVLIGRRKFRRVAVLQIVQPVIYVTSISVLFVVGSLNAPLVLVCFLMGSFATFVVGVALTPTSLRGPRYPYRAFAKESLTFAGGSIAEAASNRLDQLIVVPLIGLYQAGLYAIAVTLSSIPMSLAHAISAHYFSRLGGSNEIRIRLNAESVRIAFMACFAFSAVICASAPVLVPLVFGDDFRPALPAVFVAQFGSVFMCVSYVSSMGLVAAGKGSRMTVSQVASAALGIGLLFWLGPALGSAGAALASTLSFVFLAMIVLLLNGVKPRSLVPTRLDFRNLRKAVRP